MFLLKAVKLLCQLDNLSVFECSMLGVFCVLPFFKCVLSFAVQFLCFYVAYMLLLFTSLYVMFGVLRTIIV